MDTRPDTLAPRGFNRRGTALIGAVLGAILLAGTIASVDSVAGAQNEPTVVDTTLVEGADPSFADDEQWAAFDQCMADQLGSLWAEPTDHETADPEVDLTETDFAAFDAAELVCESELPAGIQAEIAAWAPYEDCIDAQIDAEWEVIDAAWAAADQACADVLPEDAKAEFAAFEAFDQCLADAGVTDEFDSGPMVHIDGLDQFQIVEFGDVAGSVTITGDANGISVTTDGGVSILDEAALDAEWEAFDAAEAECESLLPDDLNGDFFDDGFLDDGFLDSNFLDG